MSLRPFDSRTAFAALATAALLVLAGCSSADSDKRTTEEGPLSEYLTMLWDGEEYTEERFEQEQQKIEERIAECMLDEGFEYQPNVQTGGMVSFSDEDGPDWGSKEFAEQYGYGVVDFPGQEEMETSTDDYVDPNEDYIGSLSDSEVEAFYEALHGPSPSEEEILAMEDGEAFEYDWATAGCQGAAHHEVQQESDSIMAAYEDPEFQELFEQMDEVWSVLYDEDQPHEEVSAIHREWADCMADAGYGEYTSPMATQQALHDEYSELQMSAFDEENPEASQGPDEQEIAAFKEHEIEVAVTDASCQEEIDFEQRQMDIQFELEQQFVDEHKAELDALVAKHGAEQK